MTINRNLDINLYSGHHQDTHNRFSRQNFNGFSKKYFHQNYKVNKKKIQSYLEHKDLRGM